MGEYVKLKCGQEIKIGTCEDMYYARYEQAKKLLSTDDRKIYLKPDTNRWRFPFPQEDNIQIGSFQDYDYGLPLCVPRDSVFCCKEHDTVSFSTGNSPSMRGFNVNYSLPCPANREAVAKAITAGFRVGHLIDNQVVVEIVQQKPVAGGDLQTVLRCLWCRNKWRLGKDEAIALTEFLRGYSEDRKDYYNTVADRVTAGYK